MKENNDPNPIKNYPIDECRDQAEYYISLGAKVFQKFTCGNCGRRLAMDVPDTFFTSGDCDNCGYKTDISKHGCNYAIVLPTKKEKQS